MSWLDCHDCTREAAWRRLERRSNFLARFPPVSGLFDAIDRVMDGGFDLLPRGGFDVEIDLHLHDGLEVFEFEKDRFSVSGKLRRSDRDIILPFFARIGESALLRAVILRPAIIPALD